MRIWTFVIAIILIAGQPLLADTVRLKSGLSIEGALIEKTDAYVKLDVRGVPVTFENDEIVEYVQADKPASKDFFLVDTGQPPKNDEGYLFDGDNWIANEFTLGKSMVLKEFMVWLTAERSGTVTVAIYPSRGDIPDVKVSLFEEKVSVNAEDSPGWYGLKDIRLRLPEGEFWVAFEVRKDDTFKGKIPYFSLNTNNERKGAVYTADKGAYDKNDLINNGLRIKAATAF